MSYDTYITVSFYCNDIPALSSIAKKHRGSANGCAVGNEFISYLADNSISTSMVTWGACVTTGTTLAEFLSNLYPFWKTLFWDGDCCLVGGKVLVFWQGESDTTTTVKEIFLESEYETGSITANTYKGNFTWTPF